MICLLAQPCSEGERILPRNIDHRAIFYADPAPVPMVRRTVSRGIYEGPILDFRHRILGDVYGGDYDAIVYLGGMQYEIDNLDAQRIAQEAVAEGKVVAAICIAPITLARAGLVEAGATVLTGASVERDGLIITADVPRRSHKFGETIAAALGE